jgi:predicted Zn-dependent protease
MKKQEFNNPQERRLKFAEAGVLFVLVLALTIFIGVRVATRDEAEEFVAQTVVTEETVVPSEETVQPAVVETEIAADTVEVAAETPTPRIVTYAAAEKAYFDGRYDEAADLFNLYTDEHPANAWGFFMLGLSQWKAGDPATAADAFQAALTIKPDHVKSLINHGRVLLELDRAEEARAQVALALAANPESSDARRVMGRIQHSLGELDAAAASYLEVLRAKGDDAWSLNNLGLIRIEQGRYAEAAAPLAKAAAIRPEIACIQNNLGVALERMGHYTAAAEAFAAALAVDSGYEKAEVSLARVAGREEASDAAPLDLAALAASFDPGSPVEDGMEVAAAAGNDAVQPPREDDEPRD